MNGLLNIGSLILGLCAWMIPIVGLLKGKVSFLSAVKAIFISFVCALISMLMQMMETKQVVARNDWSALMDTQGAVVFAAIVMSAVVVLLNGILLVRLSNSRGFNEETERSIK